MNQATLSQWYRKRMATEERTTLMAGVALLQAPTEVEQSMLPAKELQGPYSEHLLRLQKPAAAGDQGGGQSRPFRGASIAPPSTSSSTQDAAPPLLATAHATHVPKSTVWNRRKIQQLQEAAAKEGVTLKVRAPSINICSHCGLRKIKQTGHRVLTKASGERVNYCPVAANGQSPEEWLASL
ncbi:hypothetical protein AMECASPLE_021759 [Ameca splendens]|uniref:Transposase n=1 Tax=Ameca splendens TaxID=208324 RepID=A0ABV0Y476_9TELE